jgi:hypothetical protein
MALQRTTVFEISLGGGSMPFRVTHNPAEKRLHILQQEPPSEEIIVSYHQIDDLIEVLDEVRRQRNDSGWKR